MKNITDINVNEIKQVAGGEISTVVTRMLRLTDEKGSFRDVPCPRVEDYGTNVLWIEQLANSLPPNQQIAWLAGCINIELQLAKKPATITCSCNC